MIRTFFILAISLCSNSLFARPLVLVSVLPQKSIVQHLAGDTVSVEVIVGKGISPENYQPSAQTMVRLAQADLYIRTGLPFEEQLLPRLMGINPDLLVLDMREGVETISDDPHIWTDPLKLVQHSFYLSEILAELTPSQTETYEQNYQSLVTLLGDLDREIWLQVSPLIQRSFLVYHPAWSYFAARYGMTQLAVEREGKEPNAREMARLIDKVHAANIKVIFVQPQHSRRSAEIFAEETGTSVVTADPLGEDYFASIKHMAELLREHN